MAYAFHFHPSPTGGQITLRERRLFRKTPVAIDRWREAPKELQSTVRQLAGLLEAGDATTDGYSLTVSCENLLRLPGKALRDAGLPAVANLVLRLELASRVESPEGHIRVSWEDSLFRPVHPTIEGILIETASGKGRLADPIYQLLRSVTAYNETTGPRDRIVPWLDVQKRLSELTDSTVKAERLLLNLRIFQAGAFALDVREAIGGPTFDPVLMGASKRRSLLDDTPTTAAEAADDDEVELRDNEKDALLTPTLQQEFARAFGADALPTHPSYVLAQNTYLVMEPELRVALDVVKRMRRSSEAERREFLKNPKTFLAAAMPELGETAGTIFVETQQYSDRVRGLGLWQKPKLDWLKRKSHGWLPEGFVLRIGESSVEVDEQGVIDLASAADNAAEAGSDAVDFRDVEYPRPDVETALNSLRQQFDEEETGAAPQTDEVVEPPIEDHQVLQIEDNIEEASYASRVRPRRQELPIVFPSDLVTTTPKQHQQVGFRWLVQAWSHGMPGVLLADDMGLGKTMQALAFLAWFRANRAVTSVSVKNYEGPILIVAPTALLRTWRREADTHLFGDPLGDCLEAFGPGLRTLKAHASPSWTPEDALDVARLRSADWILTTYETLATYHRAFARIPYSIAIFDEMQKIKAPDTINSHSAKTMNANFVIGLTGTPIENRIEDLWCVMDRVSSGYLGGMKEFSRIYGREDPEALKALKDKLDQPVQKLPPVMLRRMKIDHLPGLPERTFEHHPADMPDVQAQSYEAIVRSAKQRRGGKNDMLKTIHDLRGISLHPYGGGDVDVTDPASRRKWIDESARVRQTISILRGIQRKGEKALVFIEDRAIQATFASAVAEEFDLPSVPAIINGSLDGDKRQAVVDRFQSSKPGFGLLVLSPKAAGIGLTITAANHVIHLSRWWNPAVEDQCNDRVYRIGQEKPVTVHVPMARHPLLGDSSFDIRLNALLERKRTLSRDMLIPSVWEGEIDDLFAATVG